MSLLCNLTQNSISEDMWKVLELLYQVFEKEGFDCFTDMMPVLHNYITVDTNAFLSNENHILAIFNMVKVVSSMIYNNNTTTSISSQINVSITFSGLRI